MNIIQDAQEFDKLLNENSKVLVDFYADWCGPCQMVGPILDELSKEVKDVCFMKVNVDKLPDLAQRYGVMSIPTLLTFKDAKLQEINIGFKQREELESIINSLN